MLKKNRKKFYNHSIDLVLFEDIYHELKEEIF